MTQPSPNANEVSRKLASYLTLADDLPVRKYARLMDWSLQGLQAIGFTGFVPFPEVADLIDAGPGVYVVVRPATSAPIFTSVSKGSRIKGSDSSYLLETVRANWIDGEVLVYIGKADVRKSTRNGLARRLDEYRRFGLGESARHGGGRLIWQLEDHEHLIVGWRGIETGTRAERVEDDLLLDFMADHDGRMPFANIRLPSRSARALRGIL